MACLYKAENKKRKNSQVHTSDVLLYYTVTGINEILFIVHQHAIGSSIRGIAAFSQRREYVKVNTTRLACHGLQKRWDFKSRKRKPETQFRKIFFSLLIFSVQALTRMKMIKGNVEQQRSTSQYTRPLVLLCPKYAIMSVCMCVCMYVRTYLCILLLRWAAAIKECLYAHVHWRSLPCVCMWVEI